MESIKCSECPHFKKYEDVPMRVAGQWEMRQRGECCKLSQVVWGHWGNTTDCPEEVAEGEIFREALPGKGERVILVGIWDEQTGYEEVVESDIDTVRVGNEMISTDRITVTWIDAFNGIVRSKYSGNESHFEIGETGVVFARKELNYGMNKYAAALFAAIDIRPEPVEEYVPF